MHQVQVQVIQPGMETCDISTVAGVNFLTGSALESRHMQTHLPSNHVTPRNTVHCGLKAQTQDGEQN